MDTSSNGSRLHTQLLSMIRKEAANAKKLAELISMVAGHSGAHALLTEFLEHSRENRHALETRLQVLTGQEPVVMEAPVQDPAGEILDQPYNPVTAALQTALTMFTETMIGYSILRVHATRYLDWVGEEATSNHLAQQFTKTYALAIRQVLQLLHDVILWEMDHDGHECLCICPACRVGVCLCSISAGFLLHDAWRDAGQFYAAAPVMVQHPKKDSPAALAGLQRGQLISGIEHAELESWFDLYHRFEIAKSGDEINLLVRKSEGILGEVKLTIPE